MSDYFAPATSPTARKEHVCINCGGPILVGEKYMQQTGFYEGRAFRNRFHVECWDELLDEGLNFEFSHYSGEYPERVRAIVEARAPRSKE